MTLVLPPFKPGLNSRRAGLLLALTLGGCAQQTGRYQQQHDSPPDSPAQNILMHDAIPAYEPYAQANMRPYTVRGVNYQPLKSGKGYSAEGFASWYGQKFHGHLTSNGEVYDMYSMTAAHKTLPLPTYARITNLENGNQVVVRINDRGPFHENRLIDLSYAAALKLGMLSTGVARVKLDVVHIDEQGLLTVGNGPTILPSSANTEPRPLSASLDSAPSIASLAKGQNPVEPPAGSPASGNPQPVKKLYIQVAALQDKNRIEQIASGLTALYQVPYLSPLENGIYRLRLGPISDEQSAAQLLSELKASGYQGAYKVYLP